ncbi:MAG: hypothetical protein AAB526_00595 [Patescibacteria group bacterium]
MPRVSQIEKKSVQTNGTTLKLRVSYLPDDCDKKELSQGTIYIGHSTKKQSVGFLSLLSNQKLKKHNRPVQEQLRQIKGECVIELYKNNKLVEKKILKEGEELRIPPGQYHIHSNLSNCESLTYWQFDDDITSIIEEIRKM